LNGGNANKFIVLATHDNAPALALVEADVEGLSIQSFKTLDGQTCGELTFENVSVSSESILALGDEAKSLFNKMLDVSILCISAEAVGAMTSSYMKTVQYTKEREQFSQPISNFQVLQHRMVDMFIETELTKSLMIKATLQLDSDDPEASKTISALKVQVGKAGRLVGQHAVQLHGGMGVSNEMSIGHYLKRFTAIDSMFGNTQHHINKYQS
jgi:alkylation response protein AidB-like acyl-CoA dehydrogenase